MKKLFPCQASYLVRSRPGRGLRQEQPALMQASSRAMRFCSVCFSFGLSAYFWVSLAARLRDLL